MWTHTGGVEVGVAAGRVDGVLLKVLADVLCGGLGQQPVETLPARQEQIKLYEKELENQIVKSRRLGTKRHLSASNSRGLLPCAQPFTIQVVSKAARKPRAQPVPIGQKG